jgi:hypothetical protein
VQRRTQREAAMTELTPGPAGATAPTAPDASGPTGPRVPRIPPEWRQRARREWWLLPIGVVILLLLAVATQLPGWLSSSPGATAPGAGTTIWDAITAGIQDGTVPKDVALEAFAYVYKVEMPGVTIPAGVDGGDRPTSGSGVYLWVRANWAALTPDQQAIVTKLTTPQPGDLTVPIDPAHPNAAAALKLAVAHAPSFPRTVLDLPSPDLQSAMESDLATDIVHIANRLNTTPIPGNLPLAPNIELTFTDESGGNALFVTTPILVSGLTSDHFEPCHITAYKEAWASESATSSGVSPRLHELITHEVIHCYQNVVWGDLATAIAIPPWITEGTAFYLAQIDTATAEGMLPDTWRKGWFRPEIPLTDRSYDAFGYFNLLDQKGRDLWGLMEAAWQAAAKGPERSNAFIAVLTGDATDVRDAWAPEYLREETWGDPWVTTGFGLPDDAQVYRRPAQALPDPGFTGSLLSRSNTVLNVTDSSGEVVTVSTDGLASVHDDADNVALAFQSRRFCVQGDCVCPPNTIRAGQQMADQPMILPMVVALNAPLGGSTYSIVGDKLDDLCGRQPTPQPATASGPCSGVCPGSNGDPHLVTVNHYTYDFQAAGEFTLLRSADGSLEVQGRQEPHDQTSYATNSAIAVRDAGHRVGVYVVNNQLEVHLDGAVIDPTITTQFGGGRIAPYPRGFEIDFPDGTALWTLSVGFYGINAIIEPSADLAAHGVGLLGTLVPGGMGVPALPDGSQLPAATSAAQRNSILYGSYADAWRVTDTSSLFDYDQGKSTATYTNRAFPPLNKVITYADLTPDQLAAGTSACGAVSDLGLQEDCVFDVAVTGDAGFAATYGPVQTFYDNGIKAVPSSPPATAAPATAPPATALPKVADALDIQGAAVGPDDTIYLSIDTPAQTSTILAIDPHTATVLHQITVPRAPGLHFAAGSLWAAGVAKDANGGNCTVSRLDPATLATQATLAIPCVSGLPGPVIVSSGSAIWYVDATHADPSTGNGATVVRIDPSTGAPGASVSLPLIDGCCRDGQGAIYCYCARGNLYRLDENGTAFEALGNYPEIFPAGNGFWTQQGETAIFVTGAGGPAVTLPLTDQQVVGGDPTGVYLEESTQAIELFRQPADGSPPVQVATAPTFGTGLNATTPDYLGGFPSFATADGFAHFWLDSKSLYLQWAPLP